MNAKGTVHKYGDDVNTDVIIPARYLNTASHAELAAHCMEDIDRDYVQRARAHSAEGQRGVLRYRQDLRKDIL